MLHSQVVEIVKILESGHFDSLKGRQENEFLECKSGIYQLKLDRDKCELAKDVSAFANSNPGIIVIGPQTERDETLSVDIIKDISLVPKRLLNVAQLNQVIQNWIYPTMKSFQVNWYPSAAEGERGLVGIVIDGNIVQRPYLTTAVLDETGKVLGRMYGYFERWSGEVVPFSVSELHALIKNGQKFEVVEAYVTEGRKIQLKRPKGENEVEGRAAAGVFKTWLDQHRTSADTVLRQSSLTSRGFMEFWVKMPSDVEHVPLLELLPLAERAECHNTGWPIGVTMTKPEYKPRASEESIFASILREDGLDYWSLHTQGHFYFRRTFEEDRERHSEGENGHAFLWFDIRIWRIAESLLYSSNLIREFKIKSQEPIEYHIVHNGLLRRKLTVYRSERVPFLDDYEGTSQRVETRLAIGADSVNSHLKQYVWKIGQDLLARYDLQIPIREGSVAKITDEFLKSRVG